MKTYYTVYRITNIINGKIYVGVHKTKNLDDGYMGSGKLINQAIKKNGRENFVKEYLAIFDNSDEMFDMESELVNEEFAERAETYNISLGGRSGSFYYVNKNKLNLYYDKDGNCLNGSHGSIEKACDRQKWLRDNDPEWVKSKNDNISKGALKRFETEDGTMKGKHHTDEAKAKIGKANAEHQKGEGNSQFGTMWIYSLEEKKSKKIKKDEFPEYEVLGWLKGRKIKF